jgi:hypothetical protein
MFEFRVSKKPSQSIQAVSMRCLAEFYRKICTPFLFRTGLKNEIFYSPSVLKYEIHGVQENLEETERPASGDDVNFSGENINTEIRMQKLSYGIANKLD